MKPYLWAVLVFIAGAQAYANPCLQPESLQRLDQQYEDALRVGDTRFLHKLLAENFIWVHNLESDIENKQALLMRLKNKLEVVKARRSSKITFHRLDKTAVLSGVSTVEKFDADSEMLQVLRYRFLRTYVASGKHCRLLAVQTMKLSTGD